MKTITLRLLSHQTGDTFIVCHQSPIFVWLSPCFQSSSSTSIAFGTLQSITHLNEFVVNSMSGRLLLSLTDMGHVGWKLFGPSEKNWLIICRGFIGKPVLQSFDSRCIPNPCPRVLRCCPSCDWKETQLSTLQPFGRKAALSYFRCWSSPNARRWGCCSQFQCTCYKPDFHARSTRNNAACGKNMRQAFWPVCVAVFHC